MAASLLKELSSFKAEFARLKVETERQLKSGEEWRVELFELFRMKF